MSVTGVSPQDASLLAFAASRMTTLAIANAMWSPWTEAKVYNRLNQLRAHGVVRELAPVAAPPPRRPAKAVTPPPPIVVAPPAPVAPALPVIGKPSAPRALGPSPYDTAHPRPPPVRAMVRRPRPPAIERLKPVTDRIRRWAGWFVEAGWSLDVVADLFGVDARELGA